MKITVGMLRRIIQEEVRAARKATLNEAWTFVEDKYAALFQPMNGNQVFYVPQEALQALGVDTPHELAFARYNANNDLFRGLMDSTEIKTYYDKNRGVVYAKAVDVNQMPLDVPAGYSGIRRKKPGFLGRMFGR
jgi:hypothetical protein